MLKLLRRNMATRVLVGVANGSEEIETLTPVDLLRRAGAEVTLAASGASTQVTLSRGVTVVADQLVSQVKDLGFDMIVLPGGQPGANNLRDDTELVEMLKRQKAENKWYTAICASPAVVFQTHGLLEGERGTCYPAVENMLEDKSAVEQRVVVSGKCVTSKGPGTAMEFSLELINLLFGKQKRDEIAAQVLAHNA